MPYIGTTTWFCNAVLSYNYSMCDQIISCVLGLFSILLNPLMWSFTSLNSYSLQLHLPPSLSTRQQPQCYRDQWPPWPAQPQAHRQAWPGRRMVALSLPLPPSLSTHQEARLHSLWAVRLLVMLGVTHVLLPMLVDQWPVTLPLWQCQYQVSNDWFLNLQVNRSA